MITLATLKPRILQVLEDPSSKRFSSDTLDEAIRQALDLINQRLPNLAVCTFNVSAGGRNQIVTGLENCLFLVGLCLNAAVESHRRLEPESEFLYQMQDGLAVLHFCGRWIPKTGDVLSLTYAAGHTLAGLDGAAATTLSDGCDTSLVNGAAGQACLLRAGLLAEAYGTRPAETSRLLELSRTLMDRFEQGLTQFRALQQFGFPPGFPLDAEDRSTGRG